jgi:hypothetical protein
MGKPKAPKAPDPKETAAAQTGTNISTATANAWFQQPNQITPDGSLTRTQTGTQTVFDPSSGKSYQIPTFTDTVKYSPDQQAIADANNSASLNLAQLARDQSGRLQGLLGQPINLDGLPSGGDASKITTPTYQQFGSGPDLTTSYTDDFSSDKQAVQDAMMGRLQPKIDQERSALEQRLSNQGIQLGSDAYMAAMRNFDQGVNDQRTSVLLAAGQEQSRLAGLSRDQASFGNSAKQQMYQNQNTAIGGNNALQDQLTNTQLAQFNAANTQRQQALSERYEERARPINEIGALMSGGQVSKPQFGGSQIGGIPTVDYAGLVQQKYANDLGAYNQQMSQMNGLLGGLGSLVAKGLPAGFLSDERAKKDIEKVGKVKGQNVYLYNYRDEPDGAPKHLGLIAQEVRGKKPGAVSKRPDGLLQVDYGMALGDK